MNKKILTCFLFFYLRKSFSTMDVTTFDDDGLNFETIANKTLNDDEASIRNQTDTETEDFDVAIVETDQWNDEKRNHR